MLERGKKQTLNHLSARGLVGFAPPGLPFAPIKLLFASFPLGLFQSQKLGVILHKADPGPAARPGPATCKLELHMSSLVYNMSSLLYNISILLYNMSILLYNMPILLYNMAILL